MASLTKEEQERVRHCLDWLYRCALLVPDKFRAAAVGLGLTYEELVLLCIAAQIAVKRS